MCRNETGPPRLSQIFSNPLIVGGVVAECLIVGAIDYSPLGHMLFGTAPVSWTIWLVGLAFVPLLLGVDSLHKFLQGRHNQPSPLGRITSDEMTR